MSASFQASIRARSYREAPWNGGRAEILLSPRQSGSLKVRETRAARTKQFYLKLSTLVLTTSRSCYVFAQSRIELHRAVAIGAVDAKVRNLIARRLIAESSYAEIKKGSRDARRPIRPGVLSGIVPRLTQDIQKRLPCAPTVCLASFSPWRNIQSLRSSGTLNSPPL